MSRFVQEPDKPKAVDPMTVEMRGVIGQLRSFTAVTQALVQEMGKDKPVDLGAILGSIQTLTNAVIKIAEALADRPEIKLTKTITIKKTANQEWKATVDR